MQIGNSLEVIEAINTLKGKGPKDLLELCLKTASLMLLQAKRCKDEVEAMALLKEVLESGKALNKLKRNNDMSITKFKGQPVQIAGEFVKAGAAAPDFELVKTDLSTLL